MARRRQHNSAYAGNLDPGAQLWLLRILVPLGGHRRFLNAHSFNDDTLAVTLGLENWLDPDLDDFDQRAVLSELRKLHRQAEQQAGKLPLPACLTRNIDQLAVLVGLSETERRILEFVITLHNERVLDDTADFLGVLTSAKVQHVLSVILDLPEAEIRPALSTQGILARSGLISVDRNGASTLRGKLGLLSDDFADLMLSSEGDPIDLLRGTVSTAGPAHLHVRDYQHIDTSLKLLRPYLCHAVETRKSGVNIFLHGAPGTGKSQLARVLADELGCELFEVASEDGEGDPVNGECRLRAFRAAQSFFAQREALIVFDEAEDVFNDGNALSGRKSTAQLRKAWINRMLEDNPVPTLWLSNDIEGLDPAFIRRFDMVFELPIPPRQQRERILQTQCAGLIDTSSLARIAEAESLAPAVVAKASTVVRSIQHTLGTEGSATALEHLISNTLQAQGHRPISRHDPNRLPEVYDPAFIHADADLTEVAHGLTAVGCGRLCLYGSPGTGKTAYARWLAGQLGMPLLVRRASDLMSKWVGESEQQIAQAFRQAEMESALLLIDEVDSFLQDRRSAQANWEVSLVNEMLTQMEAFPGVFIASTNLMHDLDQAALRRFDLKVRFDFLRPEQAQALLESHCRQLAFSAPQAAELAHVARLPQLTPGDFAAVMRQHRFRPLPSVAALVAALEAECSLKDNAQKAIGFV